MIKNLGDDAPENANNNEKEAPIAITPKEADNKKNKPVKGKPAITSNDKKFKDVLFKVLPNLHPNLRDHFLKINDINPNSKCSLSQAANLKKVKKIIKYNLFFL